MGCCGSRPATQIAIAVTGPASPPERPPPAHAHTHVHTRSAADVKSAIAVASLYRNRNIKTFRVPIESPKVDALFATADALPDVMTGTAATATVTAFAAAAAAIPIAGSGGGQAFDLEAESRSILSVAGMTGGANLAVAVLDTGLESAHLTASNERIITPVNVTGSGGDSDASDPHGHGSHIAAVIRGIAPKVWLWPIKVLSATKIGTGKYELSGSLDWVVAGLDAVLKYAESKKEPKLVALSLSLGEHSDPLTADTFDPTQQQTESDIQSRIRVLVETHRIAVVAAAGNSYAEWNSRIGMALPAICREVISVGAVYDKRIQPAPGASINGARAFRVFPNQLCAFTNRLHTTQSTDGKCGTTIFAPGWNIHSHGCNPALKESIAAHGTSYAVPFVVGAIVLLVERYKRLHPNEHLPVQTVRERLVESAVDVKDTTVPDGVAGTDACDNVNHTNQTFKRLALLQAFSDIK